MKNWLNAATDLMKTQRLLVGDSRPITIRKHPVVERYLGIFRRAEALSRRR